MLVLSRKQNEKIMFPNLGITIQVVRSSGKAVRIGVDAPEGVRIIRDEIADEEDHKPAPPPMGRKEQHLLRNRLNAATLGLQLLQQKVAMGKLEASDPLIAKVLSELQEIDQNLSNAADAGALKVVKRRALVVDDNPNEGELLAEYLRLSGFDVTVVGDGLEAIDFLKANTHPDFVLLDMSMPRFNGPQTISAIRQQPEFEGLRVFAVTGADQEVTGVDVGPQGVDRWFTKPVNARELVDEMERELETNAQVV